MVEEVILTRQEKSVSFERSDNTIYFHKAYYTIAEVEEALKKAKELTDE